MSEQRTDIQPPIRRGTIRERVVRGIRIRAGRLSDVYMCVGLAAQMHPETAYGWQPFDAREAAKMFAKCCVAPDYMCVVAEDTYGDIIGMLGAYIHTMFFNKERMSYDILIYVTPSRRGSVAASEMIKEWIRWSRENNCRAIMPGVTGPVTEQERERVCHLYRHLGFEEAGRVFRMRLS